MRAGQKARPTSGEDYCAAHVSSDTHACRSRRCRGRVQGRGVAWATIPGADNTIHGCYRTAGGDNQGQLRVVDTSADCRSNETAIEWNQKGPTGATGATGATGSPIGPQGPKEVTRVTRATTGATGNARGRNGCKSRPDRPDRARRARTGPTASTGRSGPGPKGDPGANGAPGTNGTNGTNGATGPHPTQGPQGPRPVRTGSTAVYSVGPTDRFGVDVQPNNAQIAVPIGSITLPVGTSPSTSERHVRQREQRLRTGQLAPDQVRLRLARGPRQPDHRYVHTQALPRAQWRCRRS